MSGLPFTLRQLEVFEALTHFGSFQNTADKLGISQGSVSNQIKELESQLGLRLFVREPGKRPVLTGEGQAFLKDLLDFRVVATQLASHRRVDPATGPHGRLRILIGQGLMDGYIRPRLDDFLYRHPNLNCDFVTQLPHGARPLKALEEGIFDCALIHVPDRTNLPRTIRYLGKVEGGIYGHRRFAEHATDGIDAAYISKLPFIMPAIGSAEERETLKAFAEVGISATNVVGRSQYYDVIASMLERALGVASLSNAILKPEARDDVVLLYHLSDWLLVWYRRPGVNDPRLDVMEEFVLSTILDGGEYPLLD